MSEDPRLTRPEDRYEGPLVRVLGRFAGVAIFLAFFSLIAFIILKLLGWR